MKKLVLTIAAVLAAAAPAAVAQRLPQELTKQDTKAEIYANIARTGGVYTPYPEGQVKPPKPPKGYKPFYLSHMGRHGSRYAIGSTVYSDIYDVWADAAKKGNLAPDGEIIWNAYQEFFPKLQYREGNLTKLGQEQHRRIAAQMYRDFPALFKGRTKAIALSTTSGRVILSMMSFMDEMRLHDSDFRFEVDYGRKYYPVLVPESSDNPDFVPRVPFPEEILQTYDRFAKECIDEDAFLSRWFKDPEALNLDKSEFFFIMTQLVMDFPDLDFPAPEVLNNIFSADDLYGLWRIQNYSDYLYTARCPGIDIQRCLEISVTVKDIIDRFEEDTAAGIKMRLRFSHDTALMPLLSYLGVDQMDAVVEDPHELEYYWRNYNVPMGCNLQIVFFKNKRHPDNILIQVLLNGTVSTLPLEEAAPGGFYRWADFKQKYDHLEI